MSQDCQAATARLSAISAENEALQVSLKFLFLRWRHVYEKEKKKSVTPI